MFLNTKIVEIKQNTFPYPIGKSIDGVLIHFVHYKNFQEAINKWEERLNRIDPKNMAIMLTNFNSRALNAESILQRFDTLPFKNKVVFVDKPFPQFKSSFYLKGYNKVSKTKNIYATQHLNGLRYIDQFDYVSFINQLDR